MDTFAARATASEVSFTRREPPRRPPADDLSEIVLAAWPLLAPAVCPWTLLSVGMCFLGLLPRARVILLSLHSLSFGGLHFSPRSAPD